MCPPISRRIKITNLTWLFYFRLVYYGTETASFIVAKIQGTLANGSKGSKGTLKVGILKIGPADYAKLIFNIQGSFNNKFPRP